MTFSKKYQGKKLHIAFADGNEWYLYPHDELLDKVLEQTGIGDTDSWKLRGGYSFPRVSKETRQLLKKYKVAGTAKPIPE